jgi:peptide/nickel transport system substrate-binding protein
LLSMSCCKREQLRNTAIILIESSPTSLDPRIGTDAQSEHIDELIFDALVERGKDFSFHPGLATSWEWQGDRTLVFHLRDGVRFHDGRKFTSADVKSTLDSLRDGTIPSPKSGSYANVSSIEAPDPLTVILHLKQADNTLLASLSTGAIGIVPAGSGKDFWQHPIGTGPYRFVQQEVDKEVQLERFPEAWEGAPKIPRLRFSVVPDAITRTLELEKGSADAAVNAVPPDAVASLRSKSGVVVESTPGTVVNYLAFSMRDPILKDVHVRQAIAYAMDRQQMIDTLLHGQARVADGLLPREHWAYEESVPHYSFNPARANSLLDVAGYKRDAHGVRFHLTLKTSTDETTRLLAMVLQQQLRAVGIELELRSFEFATFYSDVARGAFQMYALRWVGGNEQPDILSYAFSSNRTPPKGANRGYYKNTEVDRLLADAGTKVDQKEQAIAYKAAQRILAVELPELPLWYMNSVVVHRSRLTGVEATSSGDFEFLRHAELHP